MRSACLAAVLLLTITTTVPAEESVRDRNRAWLLEYVGTTWEPAAPAVVYQHGHAVTTTASEAAERMLDEFGAVDMRSFATSATNGDFPLLGDVWLFHLESGTCPPPVVPLPDGPGHVIILAGDQFWLYAGHDNGIYRSDADGLAIEWTTKTLLSYDEPIMYGPIVENFQIEFFGICAGLQFLNGVVDRAPPGT